MPQPVVFVVTAHRWGDKEQHSYVVGANMKFHDACKRALQEFINRGGKYGCLLTGMDAKGNTTGESSMIEAAMASSMMKILDQGGTFHMQKAWDQNAAPGSLGVTAQVPPKPHYSAKAFLDSDPPPQVAPQKQWQTITKVDYTPGKESITMGPVKHQVYEYYTKPSPGMKLGVPKKPPPQDIRGIKCCKDIPAGWGK